MNGNGSMVSSKRELRRSYNVAAAGVPRGHGRSDSNTSLSNTQTFGGTVTPPAEPTPDPGHTGGGLSDGSDNPSSGPLGSSVVLSGSAVVPPTHAKQHSSGGTSSNSGTSQHEQLTPAPSIRVVQRTQPKVPSTAAAQQPEAANPQQTAVPLPPPQCETAREQLAKRFSALGPLKTTLFVVLLVVSLTNLYVVSSATTFKKAAMAPWMNAIKEDFMAVVAAQKAFQSTYAEVDSLFQRNKTAEFRKENEDKIALVREQQANVRDVAARLCKDVQCEDPEVLVGLAEHVAYVEQHDTVRKTTKEAEANVGPRGMLEEAASDFKTKTENWAASIVEIVDTVSTSTVGVSILESKDGDEESHPVREQVVPIQQQQQRGAERTAGPTPSRTYAILLFFLLVAIWLRFA